jgi:hypothetical protein
MIAPSYNGPMRLLALSPVPAEGAGCRFRVLQYVPALERAGFSVTVAPFFDAPFFEIVYQPGHYAEKFRALVRQSVERLRLVTTRDRYDAFFVYREAYRSARRCSRPCCPGRMAARSSTTSTMRSF